VFAFGGDGDGYSIGGNHLEHTARKNVNLTYVIMDNFVYGLTKKQTSPTSPVGYRSKTDPVGAIDQPINPMRKLVASGATFVARSHATQVKHMMEVMERAILHPGFSVVEILSECVIFYKGAFDEANPRKEGAFNLIDERAWDGTPEDEERHDVTDLSAALALCEEDWPGRFGVYYVNDRPTKNQLEQKWIDDSRSRSNGASAKELIADRFALMQ
jgi:2-oxoglutarate ferredoxin oxidoreductase subunit beta